jgi:alpha-amylase/alpha-mannosidase (GH57 family)
VERFICIHGHFYQPPRENPWLETIEIQDSAHPYHDWNQKITAECYAPNSASRILDGEGRIVDIVGNYEKISFDFGPTLLSWMEAFSPEVYRAIVDADRESAVSRSGHGNAMAQPYNHMIMPLASTRDKRTQIRWGLKDFEYRFQRPAEGMWLPETAVDTETLDVFSDQGIKFTILASHQAQSVRKLGMEAWEDVSGEQIDPTRPYLYTLPSGRSIHLFFYDGSISRASAFGKVLERGEDFANLLRGGFSDERRWPQILSIASDGETYGHHHKFADMALAFAIHRIAAEGLASLTNYGEYLSKYPAEYEVKVIENTSWSCVHGLERWRTNCGCNSGGHAEWNQQWRRPLRDTLDWLRDELAPQFEGMARDYLRDPWEARESYIDVILDRSEDSLEAFLARHTLKELTGVEKTAVLKLLEMQRHLMLMYTSCGWFFDELSGIETVQVIQYAGRAVQLAEELFNTALEEDFKERLSEAKSNLTEIGDGANVYEKLVKPAMVSHEKVAAHYAVSSLVEDYGDPTGIYCYTVTKEDYRKQQSGVVKLAVGRIAVTSVITLDPMEACFAVLHLGGHIVEGGVRTSFEYGAYESMKEETEDAFEKGAITDVVRLIDSYFGGHTYSLLHVFRDEQRKLLNHFINETLSTIERAYRDIFDGSRILMHFLQETGMPLPKVLLSAIEMTLVLDLKRAFNEDEIDVERLRNTVNEMRNWRLTLDPVDLEFALRRKLEGAMDELYSGSADLPLLSKVYALIESLRDLPFTVNLWRIQNIYFRIAKNVYPDLFRKALAGDDDALRWVETFKQMGQSLFLNIGAVLQKV